MLRVNAGLGMPTFALSLGALIANILFLAVAIITIARACLIGFLKDDHVVFLWMSHSLTPAKAARACPDPSHPLFSQSNTH